MNRLCRFCGKPMELDADIGQWWCLNHHEEDDDDFDDDEDDAFSDDLETRLAKALAKGDKEDGQRKRDNLDH